MVLDDYVDRVRQIQEDRGERMAALRTRKQALKYQQDTRKAIAKAFGARPARTPLNVRTTGAVERRHYRIEKLLFESRPGCLVTAHLYVPKGLDGPAPAVLGTCGHSEIGKLEGFYQGFCQRLARAGFVVLIYDPFSQGERDQYWRLKERAAVGGCCLAHNMMGKQLELNGEWFGAWRAWDGVRALDCLLDRPEVDKSRVGLTGNSGGGTMTTWLWAVEPRITMAAPSCFVTSFLSNLENEIPADCEQYPPGVIGAGLDMADFIIARAPDPVLLLGQQFCFFDRRGLRDAYDDVRRFYALLGAPHRNADLFIGPNPHGFSHHNQEAMVEFFSEHAGQTPVRLRQTEDLGANEGNVTPRGNTVAAGATPVYELIASRARDLQASRGRVAKADLLRRARRLFHLPSRRGAPHYRVLRSTSSDGHSVSRYAVDTERNVRAILRKRLLDSSRAQTLDVESEVRLFLPHVASEDDLTQDTLARSLAKQGILYLLDVRGLGESRPDEGGDFFQAYGMDYMHHGHGLLLGESYLGRRVHDALTTVDLLVAEGARRVHLYGRGQGAVIALFAALLHGDVRTVTLKNAPLSYHAMTQVPLVAWPAANFPRGVLERFDLPDCYRALGRRVQIIEPWGPDMKPLTGKKLQRTLDEAGLRKSLVV